MNGLATSSGTSADDVQTVPWPLSAEAITATCQVFGFASPLALRGRSTESWLPWMVTVPWELMPGGL